MRLIALAAAAIAASAAAQPPAPAPSDTPMLIPPATVDNNLEVTGDTLEASKIDTRLAVDVSIAGQGPYRFLIDSGADRTVIGEGLAARLALPDAGQATLHDTAGAHQVTTVRLDGLTIGSGSAGSILAPALPERFIGAQGMLGIDSLAGQRMSMDFDAQTITVQDARLPEADRDGSNDVVVTARRQHGQLIIAEARAADVRLYAVIASGADVTIANSALRDRIFAGRRPPEAQKIMLTSVTGETVQADLIYLPELRLGGLIAQNVPVAFADAPPFALFGLAERPALLLGTDLLRSFRRVSLDFRNRRVRFTLRSESQRRLADSRVP